MCIKKDIKTPRTDNEEFKMVIMNYGLGDEYADIVVYSDFARDLEREK